MKKIILNLLPLLSMALIISSCNKTDKTGLLVPKDAAMVVHFNASSFSSKLSWDDIKATKWFKKNYNENNDSLFRMLMNDPASSGVDTKSDFVFFLKMRETGGYAVADGKLKDAGAFETYCKKIMPGTEVTRDGDFSFITKNNKSTIAWNKNWFAMVADFKGMEGNRLFGRENHSGMTPEITADSLKKYGKEVLGLSNSQTLGTDERFAGLVSEPGDVHMWMNVEKLYSGNAIGSMMSMMKLSTLLENNIYAFTVNFDNGKITLKGKHYQSKEMNDLLKKYPPKPVEASFINRIPSDNVVFALASKFSPEGIGELMKITGMDGMANLFLGKANLTIDDIVKANKGEMLFAITGLGVKKSIDTSMMPGNNNPMTFTHNRPDVKFLFADAVNKNSSFDKLMVLLKELTSKLQDKQMEFTTQVKDDWFAVGTPDNVTGFFSGNTQKQPFADRISGHPLGCYIDLHKIMEHLAEAHGDDSLKLSMLKASMDMWQDVVITGGDYENNAVTFSMEVNLVNKTTNSLKQLNSYFDQLATDYSERVVFNNSEKELNMK